MNFQKTQHFLYFVFFTLTSSARLEEAVAEASAGRNTYEYLEQIFRPLTVVKSEYPGLTTSRRLELRFSQRAPDHGDL